jgi:hypothetical protein
MRKPIAASRDVKRVELGDQIGVEPINEDVREINRRRERDLVATLVETEMNGAAHGVDYACAVDGDRVRRATRRFGDETPPSRLRIHEPAPARCKPAPLSGCRFDTCSISAAGGDGAVRDRVNAF